MRNFILITCCFTIIWSCKEKPTYNPFDNQINIDKSELLKDGMDTIIDGCGYYSLGFTKRKFSPFYQFYFGNDKVLAKGFYYTIDTIISKTTNIDSIKNLNFDLKDLNKRLDKYKRIVTQEKDKLIIKSSDSTKIIFTNYLVEWENDSTFIRYINFYKSTNNEY